MGQIEVLRVHQQSGRRGGARSNVRPLRECHQPTGLQRVLSSKTCQQGLHAVLKAAAGRRADRDHRRVRVRRHAAVRARRRRNGQLVSTLGFVQHRQSVPGVGRGRVGSNRIAILFDCAIEVAEPLRGQCSVITRARILRPEAKRGLDPLERFLDFSPLVVDATDDQIAMHGQRKCVARGERVIESPGEKKSVRRHEAEIRRRAVCDLDGSFIRDGHGGIVFESGVVPCDFDPSGLGAVLV